MSESVFVLALDMGMSRIAAATARLAPSGEIEADSIVLGHGSGAIDAVAYATVEGRLLFGPEAERQGIDHPERLLRGFTRDVGDEVALLAGDLAVSAAQVCARLVRWVRDVVAEREGRGPAAIAVTHPSSWTAHRTAALRAALAAEGIDDVEMLSAAAAAALQHEVTDAVGPGRTIAVYDLGGSSFEATVLRTTTGGVPAILGEPVMLADHGGALFDDAVLRHALSASGIDAAAIGGESRPALAALRRASVAAKHALSFDGEATIPVALAGVDHTVRITRSEFEGMAEPVLEGTLDAVDRALETAHRAIGQVDLILLTGGSTHIPLVAQRLSDRFDRPLAAAPDAAGAMGAARVAMERMRESSPEHAPSAASDATFTPVRAARRGGMRAALRASSGGYSVRAVTTVSIVAASVVVAAGVAVTAFGAGLGEAPAADRADAEITSRLKVDETSTALAGLLDFPRTETDPVASTPAPADPQPPAVAPESDSDAVSDEPVARRSARQPLVDAAPTAPTTRASSPGASVPQPPSSAEGTPVVPQPAAPQSPDAPAVTPVDDPPPVDPPAQDPPPAETPTEDPAPADPPTDPAPAIEEPTPVVPVDAAGPDAQAAEL